MLGPLRLTAPHIFRPPRPGTLIDVLSEHITYYGKEHLVMLTQAGAVYVNNWRIMNERIPVTPDQTIKLYFYPKEYPIADSTTWADAVVLEKDNFWIINKPAGVPVVPSPANYWQCVWKSVEREFKAPVFVTSRLDVLTSGLLVLGKNKAFSNGYNRLLREGAIEKRYRAYVPASPPVRPGLWTHYMRPAKGAPIRELASVQHLEPKPWKICQLEVESVRTVHRLKSVEWNQIHWHWEEPVEVGVGVGRHCLELLELQEVCIRLITGRTHQIRAQLAFEGHAICGDSLYGEETDPDTPLGLQAYKLEFVCPLTGEPISLTLPSPP